jgi:hypothetical protein
MSNEAKMTEEEFREHLLVWANDGHFDNITSNPTIMASFSWLDHAGSEYITYCPVRGEYVWCGITFNIKASSKFHDVALIKD